MNPSSSRPSRSPSSRYRETASSAKLRVQERGGAPERLGRGLLVVGAERVDFVGEGVPGARIHMDGRVLAEALQPGFERACLLGGEEVVLLPVVPLDRRGEVQPV